jgi:NADPH-dependent curcumin reductase CurA
MQQSRDTNRQILLNSRPNGAPKLDNFKMQLTAIPSPVSGELLLRTLYLSLDPYMRGRMSGDPSYAKPVELGEVMVGGTVARVEVSQHSNFKTGDLVLSQHGWQDYAISDGKGLSKLDSNLQHPSLCLGVLGMPGFTAYMGLLDIGQPKAGETVVVAAASGAVGAVVGQIAKFKHCNVIGIAGGIEKCQYVVDVLKFDQCLNHHDPEFTSKLATACDKGIDIYFENVGGMVFDAVLPLLNASARVPICGLISSYNQTITVNNSEVKITDRLPVLMRELLTKRIKMQGFIIFDDYASRFHEFYSQMITWIKEGDIQFREDIVKDLTKAPEAFLGLLEGKNFGKLIVHVAD